MLVITRALLSNSQVTGNQSTFKIGDEANCTVAEQGRVSCDETVYKDAKAWKASRDQLEEEIKKLKIHLDKLKVNFSENLQKSNALLELHS